TRSWISIACLLAPGAWSVKVCGSNSRVEAMNEEFHYRNGELFCEDVPATLIAQKAGTPVYIYSRNHFLRQYQAIVDAFAEVDPLVCYSVKANSNLGLLRSMALAGSGFDCVS